MQAEQQQRQQQQQQQQQPLSFQSCCGPPTQRSYPSVPTPASAPPAAAYGSIGGSSGGNGGGWGGVNPGVIAGAALMQEGGQGAGLGALINSSSSSSSRVGCQQYHAAYHQHPGLPLSAPSGTQSDILHWEPPQWLPDRCVDSSCTYVDNKQMHLPFTIYHLPNKCIYHCPCMGM